MIHVTISEHALYNLFCDRMAAAWHLDPTLEALFKEYFRERIWRGDFDGVELDVECIVDTDILELEAVKERPICNITFCHKINGEKWYLVEKKG